jgi:hypothetical protein
VIVFIVTTKQTLGGIEGGEVKVFTAKPRAEAHARQRVEDAEKGGWPPVTCNITEAEVEGGVESDFLRSAIATIHREVPGRYHCLENVLRLAPVAAHIEFDRLVRYLSDEARRVRPADVMRFIARGGR